MSTITPSISATAKFHPVGQGCFYTCAVSLLKANQRRIPGKPDAGNPAERDMHFFYDCGSLSAKSYLKASIEDYRKSFPDPYKIRMDAGVISHFDADHVNGLDFLLSNEFIVDTVFLPYLVPFHRIALATKYPDERAAYYDFLQDPVNFLTARGVRRIVFIGSGPEGPGDEAPFDEGAEGPPPEESDFVHPPFDLDKMANLKEPPSEFVAEQKRRGNSASSSEVSFKDHRQKMRCGFGWQFKFFNYKVRSGEGIGSEERWEKFQREVRHCAGTLDSDCIFPRLKDPAFRKELLSCYRHVCYDHNNVSLALWHGPAQRITGRFSIAGGACGGDYWRRHFESEPIEGTHYGNGGTLLTGDICLKTDLQQFARHFDERLGRVNLVQLPHHGSRHSWNPELLSHVNGSPWFAATAGTTNAFGHPHNEVILALDGSYRALLGTERASIDTQVDVFM